MVVDVQNQSHTPETQPQPGQGAAKKTPVASGNSTFIHIQPSLYPILLALFVAVFLISNITATKGVEIGPLVTDGAFFLFPISYVLGDVLAECYGFKSTRRAILTGFGITILAAISFYISI